MKVRILLVAMLLCIVTIYGQDEISPELPKITPTSPEAASLGRFGNVPINASTGQMSFTVPIHTIGVDGNSWPVALQYNYGGFIQEGSPSLSGHGWTLNAYGSITKQVRGLPDGHEDGYYGENNVKNIIDTYAPTGNLAGMNINDFYGFVEGRLDSEVDKYTVNIGGMNFSFKLRLDGTNPIPVAYFMTKHNYKVEVTSMDSQAYFEVSSFKVTDDAGVEYYFDSDDRERIDSDPDALYPDDKTTAWMLSRIKYLNGQEIVFDYTSELYNSWSFSASGVTVGGDIQQGGQGDGFIVYMAGYGDEMKQTGMHRQILNSITFPKGSLEFTTITRTYGNGGISRKVFNQILLKDHTGTIVNDFDLSYDGARDVLTEVTKNNEDYYGFEYYGDLPPFNQGADKPLDQDYWKFYNGAGNDKAIHIGAGGIVANKEPSFINTRLGAMQKIIYPTGGFSEITYEQNQVKTPYLESNGSGIQGFNEEIHLELEPKLSNNERHTEVTHTFDYPVRAQLYHKLIGAVGHGNSALLSISGGGSIDLSCYSYPPINTWYYPEVIADARNAMSPPNIVTPGPCDNYFPNPLLPPYLDLFLDPSNGCPVAAPGNTDNVQCVDDWIIDHYGDSGGDFWITPGTYTFTITTRTTASNPNTVAFSHDSWYGEMTLRFYDPDPDGDITDPSSIFVNDNIGGIRVAKIRNHPIDSDAYTTYYDYNQDDGFSSAVENQIPYSVEGFTLNYVGPGTNLTTRTDSNHWLNSFGSMSTANGVPVYYTKIKKYNKVEYEFVPLPPGRSVPSYTLSAAVNPNTTPIYRPVSRLGEWPPIVIDDGDNPGTLEPSYPEGYTILEYAPPSEDNTYHYPQIPVHRDNGRARLEKEESFTEGDVSVGYSESEYFAFHHQIEGPPGDPNNHIYDADDDHPWSFKLVPSQVRFVYLDGNHCYFLNNQGCEDDIKALHTFKKYREVEKEQLIFETNTMSEGIITSNYITRDLVNNYYPTKQETTTTNGDDIETRFKYAFDLTGQGNYQSMVNKNQLRSPVQTEVYRENILMSKQKTNYLLNVDGYKPSTIEVAKGSNALETRVVIDSYDGDGNMTQMRKSDDVVISYLYGYNKNYPVAEIVGASFSQALTALASTGNVYHVGFQNLDGVNLITALEDMRDELALTTDAQVTIYTYKPLVGVTTVTDPRGYTMEYIYDTQNRLEMVKDQDGHVIQKNEYNYGN